MRPLVMEVGIMRMIGWVTFLGISCIGIPDKYFGNLLILASS